MKKIIPFAKPTVGNEEIESVIQVLKSGWLTSGVKVQEFEKGFKEYIGVSEAVAVNSCTAALHLSLMALGVKEGDEVITTPFTFASTANTIVHCGAKPVFVDIENDTYNIDPFKIEEKITSKTKGIVVVHYGGHPCDLEKIMSICKRENIFLIEDCAHAVGAEYAGRKVGTFGDCGAFSFYVTKNMTTGEGGMVTTSTQNLGDIVRRMRLHGLSADAWKRYDLKASWFYEIVEAGFKYNLSDIHAAIGVEQLKKIAWFLDKRKVLAEEYNKVLQHNMLIQCPTKRSGVKHSWHLYPIILKTDDGFLRSKVIDELKQRGVGSSVHFIPLHLHPFYQNAYGYRVGDFPVCERVYAGCISLPLYPLLEVADVQYISENLVDILKKVG